MRTIKYVVKHIASGCLAAVSACVPAAVSAQTVERVYVSDSRVAPERERELSVEIDGIGFFKNNEYAGEVMKGYSLPGMWLQPKAVYYPLRTVKLELGLHMLFYHGAVKYPNMAYRDIPHWKGNQYQRGTHALPWFRAQVALSDRVNIVFGNIYGASNHRLIAPLYSPELNLTADPETGLQVLVDTKAVDVDAWLDWQSFIFRDDTHQEAFTVGLSSRVKLNDPSSEWHFYLPVQGLAQHRGGEIDTLKSNSVQTLMNGAAGAGVVWNAGYGRLKRIGLELDAAGYYQQAGELWPFDSGSGLYANLSADVGDFSFRTAYWQCNRFISMLGLPFYGAVSTAEEGATFERPEMIYIGAGYARTLGRGFTFGVDADVYHRLPGSRTDGQPAGSSVSFSCGAYLRVNPSFLLKKF